MSSKDNESTELLKALVEPVAGFTLLPPNYCRNCNGNGVVSTDSSAIVVCPVCQGSKISPTDTKDKGQNNG